MTCIHPSIPFSRHSTVFPTPIISEIFQEKTCWNLWLVTSAPNEESAARMKGKGLKFTCICWSLWHGDVWSRLPAIFRRIKILIEEGFQYSNRNRFKANNDTDFEPQISCLSTKYATERAATTRLGPNNTRNKWQGGWWQWTSHENTQKRAQMTVYCLSFGP